MICKALCKMPDMMECPVSGGRWHCRLPLIIAVLGAPTHGVLGSWSDFSSTQHTLDGAPLASDRCCSRWLCNIPFVLRSSQIAGSKPQHPHMWACHWPMLSSGTQ